MMNIKISTYYKLNLFFLSFIATSFLICNFHSSRISNRLDVISQKLDALELSQITIIKEVPSEPQKETFEPMTIEALYYQEIPYLAKTVYGEARGCDKTQQAAIVWCILNRVDDERFPNDIVSVITEKRQFAGYSENHPVEEDIEDLVVDVLTRWDREHYGEMNVGRILPKEYVYFYGDGKINHFTTVSRGTNEWDWSWGSVY